MDGSIDGQMDEQTDRWMNGSIDGWIDEQNKKTNKYIDRSIDKWVDEQMDRWIEGQIPRWIDGKIVQVDRQSDRQIDGWLDGWIDGQIDRQTDRSLGVLNRSIHGQVLQTKWKKQADGYQWMGGQKGSWADRETNRFTSKHINLNNRYVKNKNYSCIDGHGHEHH